MYEINATTGNTCFPEASELKFETVAKAKKWFEDHYTGSFRVKIYNTENAADMYDYFFYDRAKEIWDDKTW